MSKPEFVYVIYIASTPEKVFQALTDAEASKLYWHGCSVESDWKVGSPFRLRLTRRDKHVTGEVLEHLVLEAVRQPARGICLQDLAGIGLGALHD